MVAASIGFVKPLQDECAFCYSSDVTRTTGRLFRPCPCSTVHAACLATFRQSAPNPSRCPTCRHHFRMRRCRWQRILGHSLTVGVLTAGSALAFTVAPYVLMDGLTRFFVRRNWFPPSVPSSPALFWQGGQQYAQEHFASCRRVSFALTGVLNLSATVLLAYRAALDPDLWLYRPGVDRIWYMALAVEHAIVLPLARRRGTRTAAIVNILSSTLFNGPMVHALINQAVRKMVTRGEDKVLDVDES